MAFRSARALSPLCAISTVRTDFLPLASLLEAVGRSTIVSGGDPLPTCVSSSLGLHMLLAPRECAILDRLQYIGSVPILVGR